MLLHNWRLLFVAFAASALLSIVSVNGLILERPCFIQGNPWIGISNVKRYARPVAMVGENAGHNPFNTFPGMAQYGNCMKVHFSFIIETINITIVCNSKHEVASRPNGQRPQQERPQCPVYTSDVKWPLANLVYLEYDAHRFELSSCVTLNETHSYHGQLMLTNDIETKSYKLPDYLPMWRKKLQQPGMIPFNYTGNCSECNFRNEYVAVMPHYQKSIENSPLEAQPYCRDEGNVSDSRTPKSHITMQVNVAMSELIIKLFVPTAVIFGCVLLLRCCLCGKKSASVVVPEITSNEKQ